MKNRNIIFFLALVVLAFAGVSTSMAQDMDCPVDDFIDVQPDPANSAYPAPELSVSCTDDMMIIEANAIPNFEFLRTTPGELVANDFTWEIPLNPVMADEPTDIPIVFTVAVAVNGIPIFGPNEAARDDYGDPVLDELLDYCNGHVGGETYHFHASPKCLFEEYEGNAGLVVAYSLDGYPILAPYLCTDASCTETIEISSSWQRTSDVRNAWEAHEYVESSGDLDQCNGMVMEDGSYAYFATETFPYFLACYTGEVSTDGMVMPGMDNGGQGGQQQQGQQQPPNNNNQDGQQGQNPPPGGGGQNPPPGGQNGQNPPPGGGGQNPPPGN